MTWASRKFFVGGMFALLSATAGILGAQEPPKAPPELPALEKCQAENLQLKATVVQLRQQLVQRESELAQLQLVSEQQRLEARFRDLLKPVEGSTFDWQMLQFKPPAPPEKKE